MSAILLLICLIKKEQLITVCSLLAAVAQMESTVGTITKFPRLKTASASTRRRTSLEGLGLVPLEKI